MTDAPPPPPPADAPPPPPAAAYAQPAGPMLQLSSPWKRLGSQFLEVLLMIVTLFIGWFIWWIIAWGKAQTPAKQLLKMRIVKVDERRPATFGEMALRELVGKWLLGFIPFWGLIGGIMILVDEQGRQAIWDKLADTTVVEDPDNAFGL
jgi:uncharacterized RDD family membrane protein YckC